MEISKCQPSKVIWQNISKKKKVLNKVPHNLATMGAVGIKLSLKGDIPKTDPRAIQIAFLRKPHRCANKMQF